MNTWHFQENKYYSIPAQVESTQCGTIENAQRIAAHESPRTTKLYDRTADEITLRT